MRRTAAITLAAALWALPVPRAAGNDGAAIIPLAELTVRVRVVENTKQVTLRSDAPLHIESGGKTFTVEPGAYTLSPQNVTPPRLRYHLFAKAFYLHEAAEEAAFIEQWKAKGRSARAVPIGRQVRTNSGAVLDGRLHWISIAQYDTEPLALAAKAQLEKEGQWTWMHAEHVAPGTGELVFRGAGGAARGPVALPARLRSNATVHVADAGAKSATPIAAGTFEIRVNPARGLDLIEHAGIEAYLEGVLPAEMPPSWPIEALKAQAVTARSEVIASLAAKHSFEGIDFCSQQHCRAYKGSAGGHAATDAALEATRGEILVRDGRPVATVFSSNCGGWTEDNETVWRAPADPSLRAVSDLAGRGAPPDARKFGDWLFRAPKAYCSGDKEYFRWSREYSVAELSKIFAARHDVGTIQSIHLGDRGTGGRLKSVKVVGAKRTVTIEKELPIRLAFGSLPSAAFSVDKRDGKFRFHGAGRGHGVGLCQHGARGMADAGFPYDKIVAHYFPGAALERYP